MPKLSIYRDSTLLLQPNVESADFSGQVMGENQITATFVLFEPVAFRIGDYILHRGRKYSLSQAPTEKKTSNRKYSYSLRFDAPEYSLYDKQFRHLNSSTFSFTGTASEMMDLVISVAGSPWSKGTIAATEILTAQFDKDSCRTAITKIAQLFGLEFEFKADHSIELLESVGRIVPGIVLKYGMNNGLYDLQRQPISDNNFGTRFYGYGGSKNLPAGYRSGATELIFEGFYVDAPNIGEFDHPIERVAHFPEIFPQRTAPITGAAATPTGWSISDSTLDFNLNDQIVDGSAKIVFKTGMLAGSEFEITHYDPATKTIRFNVNQEESGYILPNATIKPAIGDKYTLIGIVMPQSYIDAAEAELKAKTIAFSADNCIPKISYALYIDELYMRQNGLIGLLSFGDKIRVVDTPMGVDVILRIQQISYPIFNEGKITASISDTATYTLGEKIVVDVKNIQTTVKEDQRTQDERAIASAIRLRELQNYIVDSDGYFDGTKIRPNSIETLYLSVGAKSNNFSLRGVGLNANVNGDPNRFDISAGQLVHFDINIPGVGFTWDMAANSFTPLDSAKSYYVYAKVSRTALTGSWQLSESIIKVDDQVGFYTFQVGVLFAVTSGRRDHEFTKGMTFIIGDQITAGILKDLSGINFFNMTEGTFNLGASGTGMDFGISLENTLSVEKMIVGYGDYISGIGNDGDYPLFVGASAMSGRGMMSSALTFDPETAKFRVARDGTLYATAANISGVLNAGAGSTIGDIVIDSSGKFNLAGTKVEIKPDESIKVFNEGVADFKGASKMVLPTKATGLNSGEAALWIGNLSGITNGTDPYTLPIASASVLGGIKIGSGLSIDPITGVVSASGGESPLTFSSPLVRAGNNVSIVQNSTNRFVTDTQISQWDQAYSATVNGVVHITGSEVISGAKTFTAATYFNNFLSVSTIKINRLPTVNVTSVATQRGSAPITFQTALWSGSAEVKEYATIMNLASTTQNRVSRMAIISNTDDAGNGGTEHFSLFKDGNFVLGNGTPTNNGYKLEVIGDGKFTGSVTAPTFIGNFIGTVTNTNETLQSVTDRGNVINNFLKITGVANVRGGTGLELFYSGGGVINSYDRDTESFKPLTVNASYVNFGIGNIGAGYPTDQGYKLAVNGTAFFATSVQSPIIKATNKFLVPTSAPTGLTSGEACIWIGNLSGITN